MKLLSIAVMTTMTLALLSGCGNKKSLSVASPSATATDNSFSNSATDSIIPEPTVISTSEGTTLVKYGVEGRITNGTAGIPGVQMTLILTALAAQGNTAQTSFVVLTDATGLFSMEILASEGANNTMAQLCASMVGFQTACQDIQITKGVKKVFTSPIALSPASSGSGGGGITVPPVTTVQRKWKFSGFVAEGPTTPIPNAIIRIVIKSKNSVITRTTDITGFYAVELDPITYASGSAIDMAAVCVEKTGYVPSALTPSLCKEFTLINDTLPYQYSFALDRLLASCTLNAPSEVKFGQTFDTEASIGSVVTADRYDITVEGRYASGILVAPKSAIAPLKHSWRLEENGVSTIKYTITDKLSNLSATCSKAITVEMPSPGLNVSYYSFPRVSSIHNLNPDARTPLSTGVLSYIDFDNNAARRPSGVPLTIDFGMTIRGYLKIDQEGDYEFNKISDDGVKVWLDDSVIIVDDGYYGSRWGTWAHVHLKPGLHPIRIDYMQGGGGYRLELYWKGTGLTQQIIPTGSFFQQD